MIDPTRHPPTAELLDYAERHGLRFEPGGQVCGHVDAFETFVRAALLRWGAGLWMEKATRTDAPVSRLCPATGLWSDGGWKLQGASRNGDTLTLLNIANGELALVPREEVRP